MFHQLVSQSQTPGFFAKLLGFLPFGKPIATPPANSREYPAVQRVREELKCCEANLGHYKKISDEARGVFLRAERDHKEAVANSQSLRNQVSSLVQKQARANQLSSILAQIKSAMTGLEQENSGLADWVPTPDDFTMMRREASRFWPTASKTCAASYLNYFSAKEKLPRIEEELNNLEEELQ